MLMRCSIKIPDQRHRCSCVNGYVGRGNLAKESMRVDGVAFLNDCVLIV